ncbi:hypothetical protein ACFL4W_05545, partial [Planctomycetota bacterium]
HAEKRVAGKTAGPAQDKLLFDFETPEDLAEWNTGGVTAKLTDERVTRGKQAVLLAYQPGAGLKTFQFSSRTMPLKGCTHLQFDYFAPVNMNITVKLKSNDGQVKWDREYSLEPEAATHSIPFEGTGIDPSSLSYINIWVNSPRTETLLYVDNIRGTVVTAETMRKGPVKKEKPDPELF